MKTNPKEFDKIIIMAQAYDEFVKKINKLEKDDKDRRYSSNDIKMELTYAFKVATRKYLNEILKQHEQSIKG